MSWYQEYKKSLKRVEVEELVDRFFYRPVAFLVVKLVYNTRITPDHLTLTAMIMGLTGAVFYAFGTPATSNIGALFLIAFVVFDCSDGQLARLKNNGTPLGRLLDGIADYIVVTSAYVAIAIGYAFKDNAAPSMFLLLLLSGASIIVQESLVDFYRMRFLHIVMKRKSTLDEGVGEYQKEYLKYKGLKGKWIERNIILLYLFYSKIQGNLASKKQNLPEVNISPDEYFRKNRVIIRFWIFIGPSAARTALIITSLLNSFDIYFWITIAVFNLMAGVLWIIQHQIDKSYITSGKTG